MQSAIDQRHDRTEAELLLREFSHRTMNEVAAALASLHLVGRVGGAKSRAHLLRTAVGRLEAFGEVHRLLAAPMRGKVDAAGVIETLCRALCRSRSRVRASRVTLDLPSTWVDAVVVRRMALIAAELVTNSVRHALAGRAGHLDVVLRLLDRDELFLSVSDDGPGIRGDRSTTGTGWGGGIVAGLVEASEGWINVETGASGTTVCVVLPVSPRHRDSDGVVDAF